MINNIYNYKFVIGVFCKTYFPISAQVPFELNNVFGLANSIGVGQVQWTADISFDHFTSENWAPHLG